MIEKVSSEVQQHNVLNKSELKKNEKAEVDVKVEDKVELSDGASNKKTLREKIARFGRKTFAKTTGLLMGAVNFLSGIPKGMALGVDMAVNPDKSVGERKKDLSRLRVFAQTLTGALAGSFIFGPMGLVLGGIGGYISAAIDTYLDNKAGAEDNFIQNVGDAVSDQIQKLPKKEESSKFRKAINAAFAGAASGAKEGWRSGKVIGQGAGAGIISGLKFIAGDIKESVKNIRSSSKKEKQVYKQNPMLLDVESSEKKKEKPGLTLKAFRTAMGALCAVSGVIMNVPGGVVEGALESVEMGSNRREVTKPLLLFATNAGKVVPPAIVGATLGGPVGGAIGTLVGLVTASLTTIIDGKYGFNKRIVNRVDKAISEVIEDPIDRSKGYAVYHNAAKGTLVGAYAGLKEGLSLGYKGGTEFADGIFDVPHEVARHEE